MSWPTKRRTAIAWAFDATSADPVGTRAAADALLELNRSLRTAELLLCAFVVRLHSGAGDGTHPLRWTNR